jgi:small-conductance mechanosensitive channel
VEGTLWEAFMPFYIRGGTGPLRYSHRVGGHKSHSSASAKAFALLVGVVVVVFVFNMAAGIALVSVIALVGVVGLVVARRIRQ